MPQPSSGLRADLRRTRDHARAVGDARFELDVEITLTLYLGEDPDTSRVLTQPDAWRLGGRPDPPPAGPRRMMKRTEARPCKPASSAEKRSPTTQTGARSIQA